MGEEKTAEEMLSEFYYDIEYDELALNKGYGQRIILVASNIRKEVNSTVMWLMNYNIRIQCFRVTPYQLDGVNLFDENDWDEMMEFMTENMIKLQTLLLNI